MRRGIAMWSVWAAIPLISISPTPTPDLNALGTTLADAPDSTWHELTPGADTLEGTFDATFYVDLEWQKQSDRDTIRRRLLADGFIGGYGRTFHRRPPTEAWITEDVKAFPDATHALGDWGWSDDYFHDPTDTANDVSTPSIPNSFGEKYVNGPWHGVDIYFPKGSYVFTVTVGSNSDYVLDVATAQAIAVYEFAPSSNVLFPVAASKPASDRNAATRVLMVFGAIGIGGVLVVTVIVIAVFLVVESRRRRPIPMETVLSPDGKYWWDGAAWQPVPRT